MKGSAIWVEIDKCLGCKTCELECALAHCEAQNILDAMELGLRPVPRVKVIAVSPDSCVPNQCQQCENAPCVRACPAEALTKLGPGDVVVLDPDKCTGCQACVAACPYHAIKMSPDGRTPIKCDLCPSRVAAGLEPACVAGCPTRALHFGELTEAAKEARRKAVRQLLQALRSK